MQWRHGTGTRDLIFPMYLCACAAVFGMFAYNVAALYFVGDDAFISYRYSRNLVDGIGLVWNPGERVEGYTNFLWVLIVALGTRLGFEAPVFANGIGILSGFLILMALMLYSRFRFSRFTVFALIAPVFLVFNRSFLGWSTSGLETQFFSLLVIASLCLFLTERQRQTPLPPYSSYAFIAASLTRPEGVLFFTVAAGFFLLDVLRKQRSISSFLNWGAPYLVTIGSFFLWRRYYFGYWFPNTFYAKVPGLWFEQGFQYLSLFWREYGIVWLALPIAVLLVTRRRYEDWLLATAILAFALYTAAIGGDRFEFRFMVVLLPPLYWLFSECVREVGQSERLRSHGAPVPWLLAFLLLCIGLFPIRLTPSEEHLETYHRLGIELMEDTHRLAQLRLQEAERLQEVIDRGLLPADLRYATGLAGITPYYSQLYTVDLWGLNDEFVGHMEKAQDVVAHRKWAPRWYLEQKKVDIIELWGGLVIPVKASSDGTVTVPERCTGVVRCIRADEFVLIFETTLSERDFAERFSNFEILN